MILEKDKIYCLKDDGARKGLPIKLKYVGRSEKPHEENLFVFHTVNNLHTSFTMILNKREIKQLQLYVDPVKPLCEKMSELLLSTFQEIANRQKIKKDLISKSGLVIGNHYKNMLLSNKQIFTFEGVILLDGNYLFKFSSQKQDLFSYFSFTERVFSDFKKVNKIQAFNYFKSVFLFFYSVVIIYCLILFTFKFLF